MYSSAGRTTVPEQDASRDIGFLYGPPTTNVDLRVHYSKSSAVGKVRGNFLVKTYSANEMVGQIAVFNKRQDAEPLFVFNVLAEARKDKAQWLEINAGFLHGQITVQAFPNKK